MPQFFPNEVFRNRPVRVETARYYAELRSNTPLTRFLAKPRFCERFARLMLAVLVFSIPWEDWLVIPGIGTVSRLIGIIAIASALLAIAEKGSVNVPHVSGIAMLMFTLWSAASLLWTAWPHLTGVVAASDSELLIMAWLIWELCSGEQHVLNLLQAFVWGCYVSSIDTVFRYLQGQQAVFERYAGSGFNPNDLAILMVLSIPMSYYLSLKRPQRAWLNQLEIVLAMTTIFLCASRAALAGLAVALIIVPCTYYALNRRQQSANIIAGLFILGASLFLVPATSWQRLATASSEIQQGTLNDRTVIWKAGLSVFEKHAVFGVGAGTFPQNVGAILGQAWSAHNTFISVLVEEGLVGFTLFASILFMLVWSSLGLPRLERSLWLVLFAAWTISVTTASWETEKATWMLFGLSVAHISFIGRSNLAHDSYGAHSCLGRIRHIIRH